MGLCLGADAEAIYGDVIDTHIIAIGWRLDQRFERRDPRLLVRCRFVLKGALVQLAALAFLDPDQDQRRAQVLGRQAGHRM